MRLRVLLAVGGCLSALPGTLTSQESAAVRRAQQAYDALDLERAISAARTALGQRLSGADRIRAYELLAYSYGALDSTRQAVAAFRELIFLDPDLEPDVERVAPRITSLYASALGQVLVVRRMTVDTASFVAGQGYATARYSVSRPSSVIARVVGEGFSVMVDSQLVAGAGRVDWTAESAAGVPVPPGIYQVIITATEGRAEYSVQQEVAVTHGVVDTIPHLTSLPGYTEQPESESPPRNWRPLGLSTLYVGVAAGAAFALENTALDLGERKEIGAVASLALITGLVMSIKKPDPRPVPANILYNQLLREQLANRNRQIAEDNEVRRRQVMVTVTPGDGSP